MVKKKYITYDKEGRISRTNSLFLAKLKAKRRKSFVDIDYNGGTKSIFDFRL